MKTKNLLTISLFAATFFFAWQAASAGILAGPITNDANGHLYYLLTSANWTDSETEAVNLGGHLATVTRTNRLYQLQYRPDIFPGAWADLGVCSLVMGRQILRLTLRSKRSDFIELSLFPD